MVELVLEIHWSSCNFYTNRSTEGEDVFLRSVTVTAVLNRLHLCRCAVWAFPPPVSLAPVCLALVWAVHVLVHMGKLGFSKFCQITIFLKYVFPT